MHSDTDLHKLDMSMLISFLSLAGALILCCLIDKVTYK